MAETKYLDQTGLQHVLEGINTKFTKVGHKHTKADITDFAHTHDDRYYTENEIDTKVNALNTAISGKAASSHTHDDRYYTESEINTKLAGKSDTTHSHTTHLTTEIAASTNLNTLTTAGWYKCNLNTTAASLTNCPTKIAFAMEVLSNVGVTQKIYEYFGGGDCQKIYVRCQGDSGTWGAWERVYTTANKPTLAEIGAAASSHTHTKAQITDFAHTHDDRYYTETEIDTKLSGKSDTTHTHKYAGSATAGGSANSAVKLDTAAAGSATHPVYFADGKPVATTYTLNKSVPADAVFTDTNTHYASKNVVGSSTATANTTTALTNGNVYLNSVENGAVTSAHKISGSGATTVTTDTSGNIIVSSTNTTYSSLKNPYALTVSLNGTSQGAYDGSAAKSINVTASSVGAYTTAEVDGKLSGKANSSHTHAAADITSVNASAITGVIAAANLPSFVDDVIEGYYSSSKFYKTKSPDGVYATEITGEAGKIYVNLDDNKTYRWSGSAYVVISETIALGETSTTAYRGDRGKTAYDHASAHGSAFASGLYKITTNAAGHVTAATAVVKADITGLGIPGQDTVYTHPTTSGNKHIPSGGSAGQILRWSADGTAVWGADNNTTYTAGTGISLSGTTFSNSGVRSIAAGTTNGTISVNTGGTTANVAVKGLGSAAYTDSSAYATAGHTHSYLPLAGGTLSGNLNFSNSSGTIAWNSGAYQQRIATTDDDKADTNVFQFQQSSDTGSTWVDLLTVKDTGEVIAAKFTGALNGNASTATTATKLGTATVGSGVKPIYLNAGVATASSSTVGSSTKPVYMNAGTITQCGDSLGVSITGNAATATKATQDSAGQQINTTYIKSLTVSGRTITITKGNNTTTTITTQDTTYAAMTNDEIDAAFTEVFGS